jgi:hypothetical protein
LTDPPFLDHITPINCYLSQLQPNIRLTNRTIHPAFTVILAEDIKHRTIHAWSACQLLVYFGLYILFHRTLLNQPKSDQLNRGNQISVIKEGFIWHNDTHARCQSQQVVWTFNPSHMTQEFSTRQDNILLDSDVKMHVDAIFSKWFGLSTLLIGLKNSQRSTRQDNILLDSYLGPIAIMRNYLRLRFPRNTTWQHLRVQL